MALASLARSRACAATAAAAAPRTVTRPSRHGVGGVVRVVQVRPLAAKPEKKKGAKAATAEPSGPRKPVDLYAALVGEPPLTPTKPGEVPEWFLSVYRDWRDGTGEFRKVEQMDGTAGRVYIRKLSKKSINDKNAASKKD